MQILQKQDYEIRNQRVTLNFNLATPCEVETKTLNQAVKRVFL